LRIPVIDRTTSHSTKLANNASQVDGYPAKAGIQAENKLPQRGTKAKKHIDKPAGFRPSPE
jgi:hypothetical protein